jgi:predicted RNA-binding protein
MNLGTIFTEWDREYDFRNQIKKLTESRNNPETFAAYETNLFQKMGLKTENQIQTAHKTILYLCDCQKELNENKNLVESKQLRDFYFGSEQIKQDLDEFQKIDKNQYKWDKLSEGTAPNKDHSKTIYYNPKTMKTIKGGKSITPQMMKDFGIKGYVLVPMHWSNRLQKWVTVPDNHQKI